MSVVLTIVREDVQLEAQFTWRRKGPFYKADITKTLQSTPVALQNEVIQEIIDEIPNMVLTEVPNTRVPIGTTHVGPPTGVIARVQGMPFITPVTVVIRSGPVQDPSIPPADGTCRFNDLPAEVMRTIFSASLPCRASIIHPTCGTGNGQGLTSHGDNPRPNRLADLMRLSKKMCFEVAEVAYEERTFGIHVHQGFQNAGIEFLHVGRQPLQYQADTFDRRFPKFATGETFGFCRLRKIDILIFPNETTNRHTAMNTYCMVLALVRLLYRNGEDRERITMLRAGFAPSKRETSSIGLTTQADSSWWDARVGQPRQTSIHGTSDIELALYPLAQLSGVHNMHIELPAQLQTHARTAKFVANLKRTMMSTEVQPKFTSHNLEVQIESARNALEDHIRLSLFGGTGIHVPKLTDADWNDDENDATKGDSDDDDDDDDGKPCKFYGGDYKPSNKRSAPSGGSNQGQQQLPFRPNRYARSGRVGTEALDDFFSKVNDTIAHETKVVRLIGFFEIDKITAEYWLRKANDNLELAGRLYRGEQDLPKADEEQDIARATAESLQSTTPAARVTSRGEDDEAEDIRRAIAASIETATLEHDNRQRNDGEDGGTKRGTKRSSPSRSEDLSRRKKPKAPKPYEGKGKKPAVESDDEDDDDDESPDAPASSVRASCPMAPPARGRSLTTSHDRYGSSSNTQQSLSVSQQSGSSRTVTRSDGRIGFQAHYSVPVSSSHRVPPSLVGPASPSATLMQPPRPAFVPRQTGLTAAQYDAVMGGSLDSTHAMNSFPRDQSDRLNRPSAPTLRRDLAPRPPFKILGESLLPRELRLELERERADRTLRRYGYHMDSGREDELTSDTEHAGSQYSQSLSSAHDSATAALEDPSIGQPSGSQHGDADGSQTVYNATAGSSMIGRWRLLSDDVTSQHSVPAGAPNSDMGYGISDNLHASDIQQSSVSTHAGTALVRFRELINTGYWGSAPSSTGASHGGSPHGSHGEHESTDLQGPASGQMGIDSPMHGLTYGDSVINDPSATSNATATQDSDQSAGTDNMDTSDSNNHSSGVVQDYDDEEMQDEGF